MGVLTRISNIFRAKVNTALDEVENPIELLDQKIRDMEKSLNDAKLNSAQIIGNVHEIEKRMQKAAQESQDYDNKVKLAMSKGNEELAKKALAEKLKADKQYESLKTSYQEARQKADFLKTKLEELQKNIADTRAYRDEAAARYSNAEATKKVNEVLANVNTKTNTINLDDIERKISRKEALAEGLGELKIENSLDKEFEKLNELDLDAELAKYKNS